MIATYVKFLESAGARVAPILYPNKREGGREGGREGEGEGEGEMSNIWQTRIVHWPEPTSLNLDCDKSVNSSMEELEKMFQSING